MTTAESIKVKKDALVSALFSLSKAAQETSNATIDFFDAISDASSGDATAKSLEGVASVLKSTADEVTKAATSAGSTEAKTENGSATTEEVSPAKRKRGPKKVVDPDAPRKPVTMYLLFSTNERNQIKQEREKAGEPPLTNLEMTAEVSKRWNNMDEEQRAPWKKMYTDRVAQYNIEKQAYMDKKANENGADAGEAAATKTTEAAGDKEPSSKKSKVEEPKVETPKKKKEKKEEKEDKEDKEDKDKSPEKKKKDKKKKRKSSSHHESS